MKLFSTITLFLLLNVTVHAQYNLVPNPSFEVYDTCPDPYNNIRFAVPWFNPVHFTSPDYMNACDTTFSQQLSVPRNYAGYQFAHTGVAYALIANYVNSVSNPTQNNYREYIETQLLDSLMGGTNYCIQLYVSSCDSVNYTCNNIGVYFSKVLITDSCPTGICILPFTPQFENPSSHQLNDRNGWTLVSGNYIAQGGEKYIVIGNFKDSAASIATYTGWGTQPQWNAAAYYIDDILVSPCDSLRDVEFFSLSKIRFKLFPNPANEIIQLESEKEIIHRVSIYSYQGQRLFDQEILNDKNNIAINIKDFSTGMYEIFIYTDKITSHLKFIKL